jgi:hypothetical protein
MVERGRLYRIAEPGESAETETRNTENELRSALAECHQVRAALDLAYAEIQTLKFVFPKKT